MLRFTTPVSLSRLIGNGERPWAEHPGHRAHPIDMRTQGAAASAFPTVPSCDGKANMCTHKQTTCNTIPTLSTAALKQCDGIQL